MLSQEPSDAITQHPAQRDVLPRLTRLCRLTLTGMWLYQGLVPKLLGPHADELALIGALGIGTDLQASVAYAAGIAEIALGLCILLLPRRVWPLLASALALAVLLIFVALYAPGYLRGAFSPITANVPCIALSLIAISLHRAGKL